MYKYYIVCALKILLTKQIYIMNDFLLFFMGIFFIFMGVLFLMNFLISCTTKKYYKSILPSVLCLLICIGGCDTLHQEADKTRIVQATLVKDVKIVEGEVYIN